MRSVTLVTSVFISKAEALDLLERELGWAWNTDDPADVTLALPGGATLSIDIPKYGEDLPLTLDIHHDDPDAVDEVAAEAAASLAERLGWSVQVVG